MKAVIVVLLLLCPASALFAQKYQVRIVDRQDNETDYSYFVNSHYTSQSNSSANCFSTDTNTNCSGTTTTSGYATPAHQVSFHVRGATFTLLLPDGRAAIVNCSSKFAEHMAGPSGNHRDCRMPLVDTIEAEFKGDKAKLEWVVSLDGKKKASETYKVLAVLEKPSTPPTQSTASTQPTQ
jgi:hypothetical protein